MFVAVVDAGSFTAAGRKLSVPLPTVSRRIGELEEHLGTRLLTRSTRKLALTEVGSAYLVACRRILNEIGDAERRASGEYAAPKGELLMTAPVAFGRLHVVPIIAEFLQAYLDIDVRLILSDRNAHLLDDHIDIAVRVGNLADSTMRAAQVGHVSSVVCGSPDYFARNHLPKTPDDLAELTCISMDVISASNAWVFPNIKNGETSVTVRSRLSVNTAEAAVDAAVRGLGVTRVLSYQAAQAIDQGKLQVVLSEFQPPPMAVSILYAHHDPLPLKMRCFLDFAVPRLRALFTAQRLNF